MTENQRRKFLKLVGASLAGVVGVSIVGCKPPYEPGGELQNPTREALAERLRQLGKSKPPKDLSPGASCYITRLVGDPIPCPDCGEMMMVGDKDAILRAYNVPLKRIQDLGLDAKLIIPEHCPTCGFGLGGYNLNMRQPSETRKSPEDLKWRKFHLEIRYPDDPDFIHVELDGAYDLHLMALFLLGEDRYQAEYGVEHPLKEKVNRLRELFGVKE